MTTAPGGAYGEFCGTSSAAAFVSGLAGLARSFAGHQPPTRSRRRSRGARSGGDFVSTGRVDAAAVLAALGRARDGCGRATAGST